MVEIVNRSEYPRGIEELEKQALEKADSALFAIEKAVLLWGTVKEKPKQLKARIDKLVEFYNEISNWKTRMHKTISKKENILRRVEMLQQFSEISKAYAK